LIARVFAALGWSAIYGFAVGAFTYVAAALINVLYGPVFYSLSLTDHLGRALIYGIGGAVFLGPALVLAYALWLRKRPARSALFPVAAIAFFVQFLELGAVETLAIREAHALSWPIAEQLTPWNIGLFRTVGNWEGRPDAAFFWFSASIVAFVFAWWLGRGRR
jgi:hypothetical protein